MADKAAATRAAAASKAGKEAVAAAEEKEEEGGEEAAEEPASKKRRQAEAEERGESPEVARAAAAAEALADDAAPSSRESSPEAPVTPDVSGMEEEEDSGEVSTAETVTEAAAAAATATTSSSPPDEAEEDDSAKELDPRRFSHISDRAYSPRDVVDATAGLVAVLPAQLRTRAPNAKMFLRSFWYRAVAGGAVSPSGSSSAAASSDGGDKMHVYTLASFFLQLSLLDQGSSEVAPSAAAAGALSLALEMYSSGPGSSARSSLPSDASSCCWPACLQRYSGIDAASVASQRERLRRVQSEAAAPHLRAVWASRHEQHGYPEFAEEWGLALKTMKGAGEV